MACQLAFPSRARRPTVPVRACRPSIRQLPILIWPGDVVGRRRVGGVHAPLPGDPVPGECRRTGLGGLRRTVSLVGETRQNARGLAERAQRAHREWVSPARPGAAHRPGRGRIRGV